MGLVFYSNETIISCHQCSLRVSAIRSRPPGLPKHSRFCISALSY
ncbi:BnaCnng16330D [Brassica napus]|uniref:BnaCnng16330D protein n=1 Tax=Brassica napus TaxID=3708 RepID=A0A078IC25_BRANA|nr:BnaCnng16330D [Brassica napus]